MGAGWCVVVARVRACLGHTRVLPPAPAPRALLLYTQPNPPTPTPLPPSNSIVPHVSLSPLLPGRVRQREGPKSPRGDFVPSGLTSPRGSPRNSPRGGEELKQDELKLAESSAAAADDWTSEEQFIHPETKIRDVFADGEHVIIRLNVAGGRGTRVSRFHAYAFQNSETAVKRRVNMESEHKIVREVEEGRALAATLAKIKHNASLLFSGADQMDNPHLVETTDELRHAFDIEWDMMEIQHFVDNAAELEAIQCCMEQYYTPIRAVFVRITASAKPSCTLRSIAKTTLVMFGPTRAARCIRNPAFASATRLVLCPTPPLLGLQTRGWSHSLAPTSFFSSLTRLPFLICATSFVGLRLILFARLHRS